MEEEEEDDDDDDDDDGLVAYRATKIAKSTAITISNTNKVAMTIFGTNDVDRRRWTFNLGISVPFSALFNLEGISA